jgi:hypothetical protein
MRITLGIAALGFLTAITLVSVLGAQEEEKKTVAPHASAPDASHLWNFHFVGRKKRGDVIELEQLDDPKHSGQALVVTHLELRLRQSMRMEIVEFRPDPKKKQSDGKPMWEKITRRGEAFSAGFLDSTSEWLIANYDSRTGTIFDPGTRPSLEVTFGSGEIEIWAGSTAERPASRPRRRSDRLRGPGRFDRALTRA